MPKKHFKNKRKSKKITNFAKNIYKNKLLTYNGFYKNYSS